MLRASQVSEIQKELERVRVGHNRMGQGIDKNMPPDVIYGLTIIQDAAKELQLLVSDMLKEINKTEKEFGLRKV